MTGPSDKLQAAVEKVQGTGLRSFSSLLGSRIPTAEPDNTIRRWCVTCRARVDVAKDWSCPGCSERMIWSTARVECEDCGRQLGAVVVRNQVRPMNCVCKKSLQELHLEAERERKEELRQRQEANDVKHARRANDCWQATGFDCLLDAPHDYCYTCAKYGGKYQALRRQHERKAAQESEGK